MAKIFIDTNKYLGFYDNREIITKLITPLKNLREHILVTKQMVDEVERNKFSVFSEATRQKIKLPEVDLPEQLMPIDSEAERLLEKSKQLKASCEAFKREMNLKIKEQRIAVATSKDHISAHLLEFFGLPTKANDEQMRHARERKRLGNPPGKPSDPIGDELNWEQFLDNSKKEPRLWIISADMDFFVKVEKELFLNPLLFRELSNRFVREREVYCFDSLAQGLNDFITRNHLTRAGLPPEDELPQIAEAEREAEQNRDTAMHGYSGWPGSTTALGTGFSGMSGYSGYSGYSGLNPTVGSFGPAPYVIPGPMPFRRDEVKREGS